MGSMRWSLKHKWERQKDLHLQHPPTSASVTLLQLAHWSTAFRDSLTVFQSDNEVQIKSCPEQL